MRADRRPRGAKNGADVRKERASSSRWRCCAVRSASASGSGLRPSPGQCDREFVKGCRYQHAFGQLRTLSYFLRSFESSPDGATATHGTGLLGVRYCAAWMSPNQPAVCEASARW